MCIVSDGKIFKSLSATHIIVRITLYEQHALFILLFRLSHIRPSDTSSHSGGTYIVMYIIFIPIYIYNIHLRIYTNPAAFTRE